MVITLRLICIFSEILIAETFNRCFVNYKSFFICKYAYYESVNKKRLKILQLDDISNNFLRNKRAYLRQKKSGIFSYYKSLIKAIKDRLSGVVCVSRKLCGIENH